MNVVAPGELTITLGGQQLESNYDSRRKPEHTSVHKTGRYGWSCFTPDFLQPLHIPQCLLVVLGAGVFSYHMGFGGLTNSVVPTLVRQFQLSNAQIGIMTHSMDIFTILFTILAAHYSENGHKGRWLGISFIIYGIGSLIFTLPQWISPLPDMDKGDGIVGAINSTRRGLPPPLCILNSNKSADIPGSKHRGAISSDWTNRYFYIFLLSRFIQTIASSTTPLKITYLDENVKQKNSPVYTTTLFVIQFLSTAAGFLVGGVTLRYNAYMYRADTSSIHPGDPEWYGAWWIGFLFIACLLFSISVPMLGFAKELPSKRKARLEDVDQSHKGMNKVQFGTSWSDFPKAMKVLTFNPVFSLVVVRNGIYVAMLVSLVVFMSTFLTQVHGFSESNAPIVIALAWNIPGVVGNMLGGILIKKVSLKVRGIMLLALIATAIKTLLFLMVLLHCPTHKLAGINTPYEATAVSGGTPVSLRSSCNNDCSCSAKQLHPVCDARKKIMYVSPCHAGCLEMQETGRMESYSNCSCLREDPEPEAFSSVVKGKCGQPGYCKHWKYAVITIMGIATLIGGVGGTPIVQALLRSVPFSQRTLAMGIQSLTIKVMIIPGPIILGYMIDQGCLLQGGRKGRRGGCFLHNSESLTRSLALFAGIAGILGTVLLATALLLYKPPESDEKPKVGYQNGLSKPTTA